MWFIALVLIVIAALAIWSVVTQYSKTPSTEPVWGRIWHSVLIAVGAAVTALGVWLQHSGGSSP